MQIFHSFNCPTDYQVFLDALRESFPAYLREPGRLLEILKCFSWRGTATAVLETEYVDKQYRDSYYVYFSQKYRDYERNCLRLAFFEEGVTQEDFIRSEAEDLEKRFIGVVVLRPLQVGMIGQTFLNPAKLKLKDCYMQEHQFRVDICGRKLTIAAFPFSSQDAESMTCAETAVYNLLRYYGEKYSDYRTLSPSEILHSIETSYYERVLPSIGVNEIYLSKVLSDAHLYPRLYTEKRGYVNLERILHMYVESGIPFILAVPGHVVNCIGHGPIDRTVSEQVKKSVKAIPLPPPPEKGQETFYFLNTGAFINKYIIMDDNEPPYQVLSMEDITNRYYEIQKRKNTPRENWDKISCLSHEELWNHIDLLVPLYKRVFIDAAKARKIFDHYYLKNTQFISEIQKAYGDLDWGKTKKNPLVWRIFMTTSNKYRDFKIRKVPKSAGYYMDNSFPRFIWVLELGTLETFRNKRVRVEVLLDATSSEESENRGILSVGYLNHSVFVGRGRSEEIEEYVKSSIPPEEQYLTAIHDVLYNDPTDVFDETFPEFGNLSAF